MPSNITFATLKLKIICFMALSYVALHGYLRQVKYFASSCQSNTSIMFWTSLTRVRVDVSAETCHRVVPAIANPDITGGINSDWRNYLQTADVTLGWGYRIAGFQPR